LDNFKGRFQTAPRGTEILQWRRASELYKRVQGSSESVDDYITATRNLAKLLGIIGEQKRYAVQRGLRPKFLADVIRAQATTVDDAVKAARLAETAHMIT